jgi:hypothetical protein
MIQNRILFLEDPVVESTAKVVTIIDAIKKKFVDIYGFTKTKNRLDRDYDVPSDLTLRDLKAIDMREIKKMIHMPGVSTIVYFTQVYDTNDETFESHFFEHFNKTFKGHCFLCIHFLLRGQGRQLPRVPPTVGYRSMSININTFDVTVLDAIHKSIKNWLNLYASYTDISDSLEVPEQDFKSETTNGKYFYESSNDMSKTLCANSDEACAYSVVFEQTEVGRGRLAQYLSNRDEFRKNGFIYNQTKTKPDTQDTLRKMIFWYFTRNRPAYVANDIKDEK